MADRGLIQYVEYLKVPFFEFKVFGRNGWKMCRENQGGKKMTRCLYLLTVLVTGAFLFSQISFGKEYGLDMTDMEKTLKEAKTQQIKKSIDEEIQQIVREMERDEAMKSKAQPLSCIKRMLKGDVAQEAMAKETK